MTTPARILVAGATGHTGERLARRLLREGYRVRVLSRRHKSDPALSSLLSLGTEFAPGDCTRVWTFMEALEGCDVLFSCAHIRYARVCVNACETLGIRRYLQMSSTRRFTRFPCPSSREVIAGEAAIEESKLDYTILRPTMIFGGERDGNLTRLLEWFRKHWWFPLFGAGTSLVQPIFVEDLVDAMVTALDRPGVTRRRSFTLAGPEPLAYRHMLTEIARVAGRRRPILIPMPLALALRVAPLLPEWVTRRTLSAEQIQRFAEDKHANISKAREALDFSPRPFQTAIEQKAAGKAEVETLYPDRPIPKPAGGEG